MFSASLGVVYMILCRFHIFTFCIVSEGYVMVANYRENRINCKHFFTPSPPRQHQRHDKWYNPTTRITHVTNSIYRITLIPSSYSAWESFGRHRQIPVPYVKLVVQNLFRHHPDFSRQLSCCRAPI